jgi:thiamine-phosphate pyrophosphorylase
MTKPRFFLVAPAALEPAQLIGCAEAACSAGDCASIIVGETVTAETVAALQALGLAVIIRDCEPRLVHRLKADGIHIGRSAPVKALRETFKTEVIGVFAATSRHIAMEAAETGADYVAFAQNSQVAGEPLLFWWQDIFEVPTVAFDPVTLEDLATLLPQKPDFIRPMDIMWDNAELAKMEIAGLTKAMA